MTEVAEVVERARAVVAELAAAVDRDASSLSVEELDALVGEVWGLSDQLAVVTTVVVGEWEVRGCFRSDGSRSAAARLARDVGCGRASAGRVLRRARFVRRFAEVAAGFGAGVVSPDKVDVLARAAIPARWGLFAEAAAGLVADATRLGCDDLAKVATCWADVADDCSGRDRSAGQHEGRRLSCARTLDGSMALEGRLDPVSGAIVVDELDRLAQQLFEDDWARARAAFGDDATADRLVRTATQRRADALRLMATRSAAMPAGARVPRPLFSVQVDVGTARRVCELADGTVVAPGALVPWLLVAEFERVVFESPGRVIELGRRSRFLRGGLRRAIELRDRQCTFPGCTVPAARCDVDHVVEYVDGGLTTQANGRLRCPAHNRQRPGRTDHPAGSDDQAGPDP